MLQGNSRCFRAMLVLLLLTWAASVQSAPDSFPEAKQIARDYIYANQTQAAPGTIYCGCDWQWTTRTGGKPDLASCHYKARANEKRAERTEWEHIVPAWVFGHQRQCWQHGGRSNCEKNDPVFSRMEADLFNLAVSVGEVNGDRNNFRYGMVQGHDGMYGQCSSKTDFKQRIFEPRDTVKGMVARTTFYMYDRYGLKMSKQQQQLLLAWSKMYPVTGWERERDNRIARFMGHHNPYTTGAKQWVIGQPPSGDGLRDIEVNANPFNPFTGAANVPTAQTKVRVGQNVSAGQSGGVAETQGMFVGNKNSRIYHTPTGCNARDKLPAERNRVYFKTEGEAVASGYRLSGNCR